MTSDRYMTICKRILERCRQKKCYRPDGGWQDYRGYFDDEGKLQIRRLTHDPHTGFEFPQRQKNNSKERKKHLGSHYLPCYGHSTHTLPMVVLGQPMGLQGLVEGTTLERMAIIRPLMGGSRPPRT